MITPGQQTPEPSPAGQEARLSRALALIVTNLIKLGGLWIAVHEIASQAQPRLPVLAAALFMMTGAQASEDSIMRLASRMFGGAHGGGHEGPKPP